MSKPPLDLVVEATTLDGARTTWGRGEPDPGRRPSGIWFKTKRGDGFADSSITLPRRVDRDYADIQLLASLALVGAGGDVAYEGRMAGNPRVLDLGHTMQVLAAGWMSHAKDRKFREIYVDRDHARWRDAGTQRRLNLASSYQLNPASAAADSTNGNPRIAMSIPGITDGAYLVDAWYDAGGIPIGSLFYDWAASGNINLGNANYQWQAYLGDKDDGSAPFDQTADLSTAYSGSGTLAATTASRRFAWLQFLWSTTTHGLGGSASAIVAWKVAVYGNHGLTKRAIATGEPDGVFAADVIRDVATRWCPMLGTAGVKDTSYPIGQLAFIDPVYPHDAFMVANRPHRWSLSVWEDRQLHYEPVDLTDYDWEVRLSDHGVSFEPTGETIQELANGISVTYTDVATRVRQVLTPEDTPELADTNPDNPATLAGYPLWQELELSWPATRADAIEIGRAALVEFNRPKAGGTIRLRGHVRDRAGHWQPVWKMRADQRLIISDFPNDAVRLIQETHYEHDRYEQRVTVERPTQRIDAVMDRFADALAANGLNT